MTHATAHNGTIEIVYETMGDDQNKPLLLIMGINGQLISWPDGFCRGLVEHGFKVARFDNRDSGLSTRLTDRGRSNQLRMLLRPASAAAYTLHDMAADAVAVLDQIGRHRCGLRSSRRSRHWRGRSPIGQLPLNLDPAHGPEPPDGSPVWLPWTSDVREEFRERPGRGIDARRLSGDQPV